MAESVEHSSTVSANLETWNDENREWNWNPELKSGTNNNLKLSKRCLGRAGREKKIPGVLLRCWTEKDCQLKC